ncbi:MAG: aminotransferase class V-fold PLP-dependent enzyme, partial [Clostridiales bacterium]
MIYLDNAAGSHPKPPQVLAGLQQACSLYGANPGRGNYAMSRATSVMVGKAREKLAALFGVTQPQRLIFTAGATISLNMAVCGLLQPGDHLLISGMEHNALWRPAAALAKQGKITITVIKPDEAGYVTATDFSAAIRPETALIACIQSSNVNGVVQPIAEIGQLAHKRGIPLLVDAAQSAGLLDIDVARDHISLLAFAGHKYLYGLAGSGGLYVDPQVVLDSFVYGGTGNNSEQAEQPDFYPDHLEAGSLN